MQDATRNLVDTLEENTHHIGEQDLVERLKKRAAMGFQYSYRPIPGKALKNSLWYHPGS